MGITDPFSPFPSASLAVNAPYSQSHDPSAYLIETEETPKIQMGSLTILTILNGKVKEISKCNTSVISCAT